MAVNPTRPLALIFQRRAHVPPVPHTTPNISSSQSIQPSQCIPESQFLPQSDPTHSLADLQDLDDLDPEDDSNFLEDGVNDDVDDFFPMEESGLEDETSTLASGQRPPPPFVMRAFKKAMDLIQSCPPGGFYQKYCSFWLPHRDIFFNLQNPNLIPEMLWAPRWFYWDPLSIVRKIKCPVTPSCGGCLVHHQNPTRPRTVVDIEDRFWLIGGRYRCNGCRSTFMSWDRRVMARLPKQLSDQFPAHLSHCSGVSAQAFALSRCCLENGMGTKQVSDTFNVLHRRRYNLWESAYIRTAHSYVDSGRTFPPFPPFEDNNEYGFHPYIPSARWYRDAYDKLIALHEQEFDQYTALLPSRGIAIDHSFKVSLLVFVYNNSVTKVFSDRKANSKGGWSTRI